ncbi:hypothetical protein [Okeania sp. SIO3B5]|nr:hypothetical protein [Okeania sp. SIO3B5]
MQEHHFLLPTIYQLQHITYDISVTIYYLVFFNNHKEVDRYYSN